MFLASFAGVIAGAPARHSGALSRSLSYKNPSALIRDRALLGLKVVL